MARLDLAAAPPVALPRAFLATIPVWGVLAGVLLAVAGESALLSRWSGATLALVHAFTLGMLGNAMFGSLFQFLPAAAGVLPWRPLLCGRLAYALLNAGTACLVTGFWQFQPAWLEGGAILLGAACLVMIACLLPGLLRARGERAVHIGVGAALVALVVAAAFGISMVGGLTGAWPGGAPARWVDVHAAWGLLGWGLVLMAAVGQVVVPMFHGAVATRPRIHALWLLACGASLVAWTFSQAWLTRAALATCIATWAGSMLLRLWRARRFRRNPALVQSWRAAAAVLLAAAALVLVGGDAVVVGALVLGLAAPLIVIAMALEITAFLAWLGLQRTVPRRRRVPGIDALQPEHIKTAVMVLHGASGIVLAAASVWPSGILARAAGVLLLGAHLALLAALWGVLRRERRFLRGAAE